MRNTTVIMPLSEDQLQVLAGVLIVLSIGLLICWYSKQQDGFAASWKQQLGPAMYGSWKNSDGFNVPRTLSRQQIYVNMPDLHFDKPINSLNGMTNPQRTTVLPSGLKDKVNHSDARWLTDAFIANPIIDTHAASHNAASSMGHEVAVVGEKAAVVHAHPGQGSLTIRDGVQTPDQHQTVAQNMRDTSTTSVQMKLIRADPYSPQYTGTAFRDLITM